MGTAPAGALFRPRAPRPRPVRSWGQSSQPPPTAVQPEPDAAGRHRAGSTVPAVWGHPAMAARLARAEPGTDERSSMRTRLTIMAIVLAAAAGAIGIIVLLVILLGWLGLAIGALGSMTVLEVYRRWIQPWQHRWGATDEEVHRATGPCPVTTSSRRRPGSWRLVPGPVPDGPRLPAGQPVAGELAADPGDRLLDPAQRPGRLHHGTQDAPGHQIPSGGHGSGPAATPAATRAFVSNPGAKAGVDVRRREAEAPLRSGVFPVIWPTLTQPRTTIHTISGRQPSGVTPSSSCNAASVWTCSLV